MRKSQKSYWDLLPGEIQSKILHETAAIKIQKAVIKRIIYNYKNNFDYYCYRHGINDPLEDYIE